ncbi:SUR7/PalI family-domain-containing protein [Dipodascopsis tothii]|uniref:SUR7/PalI family-domain-containing protein n=1 Tax=Dipodascopsis tothii TaxID=44089 RepID=UPI0034CE4BAB
MLGGIKDVNPLNRIFMFEADTSGISSAPDSTRWTLWNRCGVSGGINHDCTSNHPAYAFQPDVNFGTTSGVPSGFQSHHNRYYYMSRFTFAFFMIALIFSAFAFLSGWLSLCSRLASGVTSMLTALAAMFDIIASALATALFVMARREFRNSGDNAHLGVKFFAFAWTSVFCLLIASAGFIMGCCLGRKGVNRENTGSVPLNEKKRGKFFNRRGARNNYQSDAESQTPVVPHNYTTEQSSF